MGKRTCATCDWYSLETMSCKNENSIICTTGEGGSCPHWENYDLAEVLPLLRQGTEGRREMKREVMNND